MRTTLTLDDDVAEKLKALARRTRVSFKEAVNSVIRRGLLAPEPRARRGAVVRIEVFDSPFCAGVDLMRLNQLGDDLDVADQAPPPRR